MPPDVGGSGDEDASRSNSDSEGEAKQSPPSELDPFRGIESLVVLSASPAGKSPLKNPGADSNDVDIPIARFDPPVDKKQFTLRLLRILPEGVSAELVPSADRSVWSLKPSSALAQSVGDFVCEPGGQFGNLLVFRLRSAGANALTALSSQVLIMECGKYAHAVTFGPIRAEKLTLGKEVALKLNSQFVGLELRNVTLSGVKIESTPTMSERHWRFALHPDLSLFIDVELEDGPRQSVSARLEYEGKTLSRKGLQTLANEMAHSDRVDRDLAKAFLTLASQFSEVEIRYEIHGSLQRSNGVKLTVPLVMPK